MPARIPDFASRRADKNVGQTCCRHASSDSHQSLALRPQRSHKLGQTQHWGLQVRAVQAAERPAPPAKDRGPATSLAGPPTWMTEIKLPEYDPKAGTIELVIAGAGPSGLAVADKVSQSGAGPTTGSYWTRSKSCSPGAVEQATKSLRHGICRFQSLCRGPCATCSLAQQLWCVG